MSFEFQYNYPQIARESGFKLRQFRDGPIDWRLVGSLEVERIIREQQFENIDAILLYLSEAPLASMLEINILDSGIAKYFIISQLAIQYLIFCRKFLGETVRTLRESLIEAEVENGNLKTVNQGHSNEIVQLHKKLSQIESINETVFPCHMCTKNFVSNDALNVHLKKKHSKSQTGDIQYKDNDRTLINTIKLELEIKQLKERLNIAEKDIRETVESKKRLPIDMAKTCSCTQIHATTNDVGTQINLVKTNENNLNEEVTDNKLEILSQLQEKILKLETWHKNQCTGNQQSINDITEKLSEITESIQSRSENDAELLRKWAYDAILSSTSSKQILPDTSSGELQTIVSNTVSKELHLNSEKLKQILNKIETIYEEKLPSLEMEIQKSTILAQERNKEAMLLPSMEPELFSNIEEHPFDEKETPTHNSRRTYSIEKPTHIYSEKISDCFSTDISESQENYVEVHSTVNTSEANLPIASSLKTVNKYLEKKMRSYGINLIGKTISSSDAANISKHLAEHRSSLKNIYPRLHATRKKLKNLVDQLSSEKYLNKESHEVLHDIKFKQQKCILGNFQKITENGGNSDLQTIKPKYDKNVAFKKRLEKILSSPIKKPTPYVTNHTKQSMKPIPMPRKRVVFYNPEHKSTGDEESVTGIHPTKQIDLNECK